MSKQTYTWQFPLPRTHTGILQGNGLMGVMIWGEANVLRITLNRGDFWDHRGGKPWVEGMSYARIRELLENDDEAGLRALFEGIETQAGEPARPSLLPLGRLELIFDPSYRLTTGALDTQTGQVTVMLDGPAQSHQLVFNLAMDGPLLHLALPQNMPQPEIKNVTAWEYVGDYLESISFEKPQFLDEGAIQGWIQKRPVDPPLCLGYCLTADDLWLGLDYGDTAETARTRVLNLLDAAKVLGPEKFKASAQSWWASYWASVSQIDVPNEQLRFLYQYGLYKFAGLTNPDNGLAAGLQGPWLEEYQMPPWSGDYHFNINVQMCYWPAYRANRLSHLKPVFDLLTAWLPLLRENARIFAGVDDGLMLPHAVDDRGTCMGGFWSGSVDHGSTAWMAEMMYRYYQYSGDMGFLRETAYPFMRGTMRVYEAMLEKEGEQWSLPVSVSPEYRGNALNAWGKNASFQLACIHYLLEALQEAASVLGEEPEPIWADIQANLPKATLWGQANEEQIAMWEGTPLEESHRHHSHLGGISPFDILDLDDPAWQTIYENTLNTWIKQGMGLWSGWCVPWASMIHSRFANPEMAELLLEIWQKVYTNEGHGTLHDPNIPGFTLMGGPSVVNKRTPVERMQMDAGMAATTAIMEMLLLTRRGVNYVFNGAPKAWNQVSFTNIRTTGAFLVSAERIAGEVTQVEVYSEVGGIFKLANPWVGKVQSTSQAGENQVYAGDILEISMTAGQVVILTALTQTNRS